MFTLACEKRQTNFKTKKCGKRQCLNMDLQKGKRRIFIFNFISLDHMPKLISITTDETDTLFVNKTTSYSAIHMVRDGPLEN